MSSFKNLRLKINDFYKKYRNYFDIKSLLMLVHSISTDKKETIKDYSEERKFVSNLIVKVLTSQLCVREALLSFPKDADDTSLKVAWHALIHFEADEDLAKTDSNYQSVQFDFLEMIFNGLKEGKELPQNLITEYNIYYNDVVISKKDGWRGLWQKLTRYINT